MRRLARASLTWLLAFTGTAALLATHANAQESVPNDACTTAGLFRQSSGTDQPNSGYTLFCDGARWIGMIEYRSTGDLYFSSAGAIALPDGTTAQRPAVPVAGMIRYNVTLDTFEGYVDDGTPAWEDLLGGGSASAAAPDRGIQFNSGGSFAATGDFVYTSQGDLLLVGTHTGTPSVPVSGAGSRVFFDAQHSTFRAGSINGSQWNDASMGEYSAALGRNVTASGQYSMALGYYASASGNSSTAIGHSVLARGVYGVAMGRNTTASGLNSAAFGRTVRAGDGSSDGSIGEHSFAFGLGIAAGTEPMITGDSSFGIFMGDQSGVDLSSSNTMAILGGEVMIDYSSATSGRGCIRYNETSSELEFSNDCSAYSAFGGAGGGAIDDLSDAMTSHGTDFNLVLGHEGASITGGSGQYNTLIGRTAGDAITTGDDNVALGYNALSANATQLGNTALGTAALQTTTSDYNTAVGWAALQFAANANRNTAVGASALRQNTTGIYNTAVGFIALAANTTKSESTAIGFSAMEYADSAAGGAVTYNTALGAYALRGSATAASNTGIRNTAIGHSAMIGNTSGSQNVAVGQDALRNNTTGGDNVAIGYEALAVSNSNDSVAIGSGVLRSATGGTNTGVGTYTMWGMAGGYANTAIGYWALGDGQSATWNVAVGRFALGNIVNSNSNVAVGTDALLNLAGNGHNDNTAIGNAVGASLTAGDRNILIGANVDVPQANISDRLNIGNVLTGDMATGNIAVNGTAALKVPHGTTAQRPTAAEGMIRYNSTLDTFEGYVDDGTPAWEDLLGGGSASAAAPDRGIQFNSGGSFAASADLTWDDSGGDNRLMMSGANTELWLARTNNANGATVSHIPSGAASGSNVVWLSGLHGNSNNYALTTWDGTTAIPRVSVGNTGNVGIGTTTPNAALSLGNSMNVAKLLLYDGGLSGAGGDGFFSSIGFSGSVTYMTAPTDGQIDIGRYTAQNLGARTSWMFIDNNGLLGVGTTSPGAKLHSNVTSTAGNAAIEALRLSHQDSNSAGANGIGVSMSMVGESDSNGVFPEIARIQSAMSDVANASKDSYLAFYTLGPNSGAGSNTATEKMRLTSAGHIGLGTTTPFTGWSETAVSPGLAMVGTDPIIGLNDTGGERWIVSGRSYGLSITNDTDNLERFVIDNDGDIGIGGTATPAVELDVTGDIQYTGTIADVSDRRLKKDIENLAAGQLEKLIRLQGVSFKMLSDPDGRTELGLIAQDVQAVFPELVQEGGSGTLSLNYSGLIAPMIEAIKEQQAEIDELKTMNAALVARIEKLEAASASP